MERNKQISKDALTKPKTPFKSREEQQKSSIRAAKSNNGEKTNRLAKTP